MKILQLNRMNPHIKLHLNLHSSFLPNMPRVKYVRILQWNCRGIKANITDLQLLLTKDISVACLQESRLPHDSNFSMKYYSTYNFNPNNHDAYPIPGGLTTLIHNSIPHRPITLNTSLQAQAFSVSLNYTTTICNIYIPPHSSPDRHSIENLLHQLPSPYILLGDFNAHHPLWGSQKHNPKGILIENILLNNNITLLNHKKTNLYPSCYWFSIQH